MVGSTQEADDDVVGELKQEVVCAILSGAPIIVDDDVTVSADDDADDDVNVSADDDVAQEILDQELMLVPLDDAMLLLVLAVSESSS